MNSDAQSLSAWVMACLIIASICTTAFPVLYFFSGRWYADHVGRALMGQSIAFAVALDLTLLLKFWHPHPHHIVYVIAVIAYTAIAATTAGITGLMVRYNYFRKENSDEEFDPISQQQDV